MACFLIQAIGIGTLVTYGLFFNPLMAEFGWPRATIAGAASVSYLLSGLLGIFVGRIIDRVGPRATMTVSGFSYGLGLLLMSRLDAVWQAYLFYGAVVGIGMSAVDVVALSTTARWFFRRRGTMTGIVKVGTGTGQLVIPFVTSQLILSYGWRTSYLVMGTGVMLLLVSIAQLLRRDQGQTNPAPDPRKGMSSGHPSFLRETLHTRQFWTLCGANLAIVFCLMTVIVHIVPHARDARVSAAEAAGLLSVIGGVSIAGRFVAGFCIDRTGSRRVMIICFFLLIAGLLWLQTAREMWHFYLFAAIYGIAHGGFYTAISPIVAEFFGIEAHGVLFGIVAFSGTVGSAVGPTLAGYIFDATAGYGLALWLCTFLAVLGLVLTFSLKAGRRRIQ